MCVAMPGKVIEIYETDALVDFSGNLVRAIAAQDRMDLCEELEEA